jgi:hypothetical protein
MIKNSKGQALLLVIAAMTVALALGINVSMRTLQSVSRTTRTDTSERILGAAEGGIERALKLAPGVLDGGINNTTDCSTALMGDHAAYNSTLNECVVTFTVGGDPVTARAIVHVDDFTYTDPASNTYQFKLEQDSVTEVNVNGVTSAVNVCWTPVDRADVYYVIYGDSGILDKKGWRSKGADTPNSSGYNPHNFIDGNPSGKPKNYCSSPFNLPAGSKGLRIRSIGGDSTIEIISTTLQKQGHRIISTGELTTESTVKSKKVITVYKSLPFLPGIFDFSIMSNQGPLLN